jgi:virulence-associated protein VapD
MAYFVVNYQLNQAGQDYEALKDEFERLGAQKAQRTVYLVDCTAKNAAGLLAHLRPLIDENDMMLVTELTTRPASFRSYEGTKDWLDARF